ncbi:hypothetical protein [Phyllobacterium sp. 22552]|uniref:hypothetical protein n=1 Tax=Phyllobacterium sp. 22552 TaxID=3453941 RepID=UPI003F824827
MSLDIFINCFEAGETGYFRLDLIDEIFGPFVVGRDNQHRLWKLDYGQNNTSDLYFSLKEGDASLCSDLTINRPCSDPRLYDALLSVLRQSNSVLFYPTDDDPPLIGKETTRPHLPEDMVTSLGTPVIARSGTEIIQTITD